MKRKASHESSVQCIPSYKRQTTAFPLQTESDGIIDIQNQIYELKKIFELQLAKIQVQLNDIDFRLQELEGRTRTHAMAYIT